MSSSSPIAATRLRKCFGDLVAVDSIDFEARAGACLGLLGPNGAGKTTTIEMLEGLQTADGGEVRILGRTWHDDEDYLRENIGVQLQETRMPEKLTAFECLRLFRSFYREGRDVEEVLRRVELQEKRDTRTGRLSGGQRQRLALGCAIVGSPQVLFLDEPTTGLDPQARRRVWDVVEEFKAAGCTVLLTTHYMDEAERLADDLVILDHGKVIARGSPASIIESLGAEKVLALKVDAEVDLAGLRSLEGVVEIQHDGLRYDLSVRRVDQTLPALLRHVQDLGREVVDLNVHRPNLEDVFVSLTGRKLRDG
jgi:ABC-2 type transport system ATP-binding protein